MYGLVKGKYNDFLPRSNFSLDLPLLEEGRGYRAYEWIDSPVFPIVTIRFTSGFIWDISKSLYDSLHESGFWKQVIDEKRKKASYMEADEWFSYYDT